MSSLGFRVIIYLDDIILLNQCKIVMVEQLDFIKRLLQILGFVINSEKSRGQIDGIFGYDRVLSFHAVPFARKKVGAIGTRSTELARKSSNSGNSGSVCAGTLQRGESSLYKMLKRE